MTKENTSVTPPSLATLKKRAIIGATIGLVITFIFIISADKADASWSKLWFIKPLVLTPLATAVGGAFYYYIEQLFFFNGWKKALAIIIGLIGFVVSLWLGMVLGFNGTYWN